MVLKVVTGKILETLELRVSGLRKTPVASQSIEKKRSKFPVYGGWGQNIGNMGVRAIPGRPRFRFETADARQIVKDRELSYR